MSGKVRYTQREDNLLALPVPIEMATNKGMIVFNNYGCGVMCAKM